MPTHASGDTCCLGLSIVARNGHADLNSAPTCCARAAATPNAGVQYGPRSRWLRRLLFQLRLCAVRCLLDPAEARPWPESVRLAHLALVAAYVELVAAVLCDRAVDSEPNAAMLVPAGSVILAIDAVTS